MKGKLCKDGVLYIDRAGVFAPSRCKWENGSCNYCRDHCPSFREPMDDIDSVCGSEIEICDDRILFEEFEDER